ncbi:MAG: hypothetical protein PHU49_13405 [Syntrophorhabdaceae bacterium]|nr:hypothetical protein [Syntrophorhabdaceae bacterium]
MTLPSGIPTLLLEASQGLDTLGIVVKFGRKHLKDNDSPPVVIWYPTRDQITSAQALSTDTYRSIRTRNAGFNAFIWGKSYDQSVAIAKAVIRLVWTYNLASADFGDIEWNVKADDAWTVDGHGCLLPVTFRQPITSQAEAIPSTETALESNPTPEDVVTTVAATPGDHEATLDVHLAKYTKPTPP